MGFFSWNCVECGHPMLSVYAVNEINAWMMDVVVHEKNGTVLRGEYDGYGRVGDREIRMEWEDHEETALPCCRHKACWEKAGKPGYVRGSDGSDDQGYFFNEGAHTMEKPKVDGS